MDDLTKVLVERGNTHGDFTEQARLAQSLKGDLRKEPGYGKLSATQRESLDMIMHKAARVVTGNPNLADHWLDIEGYARITRERIVK